MHPLSCVNCCHNPLQLGAIGPAFGYCTRHRVILPRPHASTCGQLLRKDLLAASAVEQRALHEQSFRTDTVSPLIAPPRRGSRASEGEGGAERASVPIVEKPNGQMPGDAVLEEVKQYGQLDSKIATIAALRRIEGPRAEVAMLGLSRGYVSNCFEQGGPWTAGLHVAYWTLQRLTNEPRFSATDVRGPYAGTVEEAVAIAAWTLVAFRMALLSDVADRARRQGDRLLARLVRLTSEAIDTSPLRPDLLLGRLRRARRDWQAALTQERYEKLSAELRRD